jgi:hypothetical protein
MRRHVPEQAKPMSFMAGVHVGSRHPFRTAKTTTAEKHADNSDTRTSVLVIVTGIPDLRRLLMMPTPSKVESR